MMKENYIYLRYHNDINKEKSRVEMEIFRDWYNNPEDKNSKSPFENMQKKLIK